MKNRRAIITALSVAVLVIAAIWLLTSRNESATPASSSKPGSASQMVMPASTGAQLSAEQIRQSGIAFDTVKVRTLSSEVRAPGIVTLDETRMAQVTPKFSGFVERLYVNATGQQVSRGQPVAAIYSPELVAAQNELLLAASLDRSSSDAVVPGEGSTRILPAARQRLRLWDISDSQIDEILRTGKVRRSLTLSSPVSGIVVEKNVVQGQSVTAGMPLLTVGNLSTVWVTVEIRESDAGVARTGATANVELAAFPGEQMQGRISYIYPTLQPEARTIRGRIVLPNPGGRIKPGMYATVRINSAIATALTVPASAVIQSGDRSYLFVRRSSGNLIPVDVRIGRRGAELVEIISGLKTGEIVVTSAQFLLDSESNLGEVMRSMIGQGAAAQDDMEGMAMPPASELGGKAADMKGMNMPPATKR